MFQCFLINIDGQELPSKINDYQFTTKKLIGATSVKNQNKSSTCWIYSTHSFLESELIRMGKPPVDLSEMFVARAGYLDRADLYMRRQGNTAFGQGAENGDVMNLIKKYGLTPQSVYSGMPVGQDKPVHFEMEAVLKGILDNMLTPPETFVYEGKTYSPNSFVSSIGINPDDYIAITSFTHHPFYKPFILEVADNWAQNLFYNVPVDELKTITDHALENGYSVIWATDVSEKTFSREFGLAINTTIPWEDIEVKYRDSIWKKPQAEKLVTQEERQYSFDQLLTTDDHGMHIIGNAVDQNGTSYYIVKNSWGTSNKITNGYIYASDAYFRHKTISIMVHKNAIPKAIRSKLGL